MTIVIRYNTHILLTITTRLFFLFPRNNNILRYVIVLPTRIFTGTTINSLISQFSCINLNHNFPLQICSPGKILTNSTTLNCYTLSVPSYVSTNIKSDLSTLKDSFYDVAPNPCGIVHIWTTLLSKIFF